MAGRTREQKRRDKVLASHRRVGNALYSGTGLPSWLLRLCWWRSLPRTERVRDVTMASARVIALMTEVLADDRLRAAHQGPYRLGGFQWWNPLHWVALLSRVIQRATHRRQVEKKRKLCAYHFGQRLLRAGYYGPPVLESADREAFWSLLRGGRFGAHWVPVFESGELLRQDDQDHKERMEQIGREEIARANQLAGLVDIDAGAREAASMVPQQMPTPAEMTAEETEANPCGIEVRRFLEQDRRDRGQRAEQDRRAHEQQIEQIKREEIARGAKLAGLLSTDGAVREASMMPQQEAVTGTAGVACRGDIMSELRQRYPELRDLPELYGRELEEQVDAARRGFAEVEAINLDLLESYAEIRAEQAEIRASIADYNRRVDDYLRSADNYLRSADNYLRNADGYLRSADDYLRNADDYLRNADGYLRSADDYLRNADGYIRRVDAHGGVLDRVAADQAEIRAGIDDLNRRIQDQVREQQVVRLIRGLDEMGFFGSRFARHRRSEKGRSCASSVRDPRAG